MTKDEAFAFAARWKCSNTVECPRCARFHSFLAPDGTRVCPPCWFRNKEAAPAPVIVVPPPPKPVRRGRLEPGINDLFGQDLLVLAGTYLDAEEQGQPEEKSGRTSAMKRELVASQPPLIDLEESFPGIAEVRARVAERRVQKDSLAWSLYEEIAGERNEHEVNRAFTHYVCAECGVLDRTTLRKEDLGRTFEGARVCAECWTLAFAPYGRLYGTTLGASRCRRDAPPREAIGFDE